jgi:glutathione-regulated potassium-efflux system ancillary protein KefG
LKILVIVAHPHLKEKSRANLLRVQMLEDHPSVTVHDLYRAYPNWTIDVQHEQQLLLDHDRIVLQYPFFWYNVPPLLKKWFDDVLKYGWAYGTNGVKLKGKQFILAITTGGAGDEYQAGAYNWFSISEFVKPIQATIARCNGMFLPSFVTYHIDHLSDEELKLEAEKYVHYINDKSLRNYAF